MLWLRKDMHDITMEDFFLAGLSERLHVLAEWRSARTIARERLDQIEKKNNLNFFGCFHRGVFIPPKDDPFEYR